MQENRFYFKFYISLLCICSLLLIGITCGVLSGCSGNTNRAKASKESGEENSIIVKPPKIGELVTTEQALGLCEHYNFDYLVKRLQDNPDHFKAWEFDGCSMTPTEILSEIIEVPSLSEICLKHDLGYAYGEPGNEEERLKVDKLFQSELLNGGASEFVAKTMFNAVREGGKEKFCLSFTWSYARVEPCKRGFGFRSKN